jgi:hypothetical protein
MARRPKLDLRLCGFDGQEDKARPETEWRRWPGGRG